MIIVLKRGVSQDNVEYLLNLVKTRGLSCCRLNGLESLVFEILGDESKMDLDILKSLSFIDSVSNAPIQYKKASRDGHKDDSIIHVGNITIGGGNFHAIAGPCSIEDENQIVEIAKMVKKAGATILRGGAFKPRTSPYSFQGYGLEALKWLSVAKKETGLITVSEIMSADMIEAFEDIDILQIGARNMQNYDLLKCVGKSKKPVLLKRNISATVEEFLMSAEYIMAEGNNNIILCERGIRTFEHDTRNTLDISAIPLLKGKTHLPIFVDPSHAAGASKLVEPLSLAATSAGADGIMIEVHNNPTKALSDGMQALTPEEFESLFNKAKKIVNIIK